MYRSVNPQTFATRHLPTNSRPADYFVRSHVTPATLQLPGTMVSNSRVTSTLRPNIWTIPPNVPEPLPNGDRATWQVRQRGAEIAERLTPPPVRTVSADNRELTNCYNPSRSISVNKEFGHWLLDQTLQGSSDKSEDRGRNQTPPLPLRFAHLSPAQEIDLYECFRRIETKLDLLLRKLESVDTVGGGGGGGLCFQ